MENLIGTTLNTYQIVAKLGQGGMAEVYKAYQPGLDRYVAIKVMHRHLSSDEGLVKRFQREALATARLSHPNIVQVLDFSQAADLRFMVMQFINGPTLEDEIKARRKLGRPFSLPEIARLYLALGSAIDYAHRHQMVHRDLKPANVMIDAEGQALLTDFGIARLLDATQFTATGAMIGTPAYMSPEQGRGEKVDGRSDLYTLGVILYELVTGTLPFDAPTPIGILMKHVREPLPPPSKRKPDLPPLVEQVIVKALAKAPAERYQTAGALAQALAGAVGLAPGDSLLAHPLKPVAPPPHLRNELDPQTARFTPVEPTQGPVTPRPTVPATPPPASVSPAPVTPVPPRRAMSPVWLSVLGGGLLAVVAGLGFFFWNRSAVNLPTPAIVATATAAPVVEVETTQPAATATPASDSAATATAMWQGEDADGDGLTNAAELDLGTGPDQPDSDQDELADGDEINRFNTDPLKADSDGDGLPDSVEMRQGLNPLRADSDRDGLPDASDSDPIHPSTPIPTETPTLAASATPPPTEEPTVPPTPTAAPVRVAAGPGVFQDFETQSSWKRGDQANGNLSRSASQVHGGSYAGQLDYNFPTDGNDFVVFLQSRALAGEPTALTAWVYGDGAGHFLNVWIKDSAGQTWGMTFGQVEHTGWQQLTARLDPAQPWPSGPISGPDNGQIDYPISFQALTLDDGNDSFSGQGTLYLDDLSSQERIED